MALDYKSGLARYRKYLQVVQERPLWKASLFVILSLVLTIAMVILALKPTLVTVAGLVGQIRQQKEVARKLNEKISAVQKASGLLEQNRDRLSLLDLALPGDSNWADWANMLVKSASDSGLAVSSVVFGPVPAGEKEVRGKLPPGAWGVAFSVTASGQYPQIKDFVERVENLSRVSVLTDVRVVKEKDGSLVISVQGVSAYEEKK